VRSHFVAPVVEIYRLIHNIKTKYFNYFPIINYL